MLLCLVNHTTGGAIVIRPMVSIVVRSPLVVVVVRTIVETHSNQWHALPLLL